MSVKEKVQKTYHTTLSWLARCRWNVIDLITIIGHGVVPSYLFIDIDMTWVEELRKQLNAAGHKVTITSFLLKAIGLAQRKHPDSRTNTLPWGRTFTFNNITAGFTVEKEVDDQAAVFFGTIDAPDSKPLDEIARELKMFAEGKIAEVPQLAIEQRFYRQPWLFRQIVIWAAVYQPYIRIKYLAATFGLTSLGKFGTTAATGPCICSSTFGVGVVEDRPVVRDGQVVVRPMMTLSLVFDNRVMNDSLAVEFLKDVQSLLEGGLEEFKALAPKLVEPEANKPAQQAS